MRCNLDDPDELRQAVAANEVSPILRRFGAWAVITYGVESLDVYYHFPFKRTSEMDWVEHMRSKTWVSVADFTAALGFAREIEAQRSQLIRHGGPLRVFMCHAKEDIGEVRRVHSFLVAMGTEPWLDEEDLIPGQDWQYEIKRQIPKSDLVIAFISKNSVHKTGYVQRELRMAVEAAGCRPEGSIYIIPALLDECDIPESLNAYQGVDLFRPDGLQRLYKSLVAHSAQIAKDHE